MGDVRHLRPPPGPPVDDPLLGLPTCPVLDCAKCGRSGNEEPHVWISKDFGCGACSPENERHVIESAGMSSRVFLLEEALRIIQKKARVGSVGARQIQRVLDDLKLTLPPGDGLSLKGVTQRHGEDSHE